MNLRQVEKDFNQKLARFRELMKQEAFANAEQTLREAIQACPADVWRGQPEYIRLQFEGYRAICLFHLAQYQAAISILERASQARRRAKVIDHEYLQQMRILALAVRGICDFDRCIQLLTRTREEAILLNDQGIVTLIENDIAQTEAIQNDSPHQALPVVMGTAVFRGSYIGDRRIKLPKDVLNISCTVTQLDLKPVDLHRLKLSLKFTLNNSEEVSQWSDIDPNLDDRTPILFALLLPRNARVNFGSFRLDLNDPDPNWQDNYFFIENQFYTILHPDSYPLSGFRPVPKCKSYKYVRGDCSLFRSRLPKTASVHFEGVIDYPIHANMDVALEHDLSFFLLLPYGKTVISSVDTSVKDLEPELGFQVERLELGATSFKLERDSFLPNMSHTVPPLKPETGDTKIWPSGILTSPPINSSAKAAQGSSTPFVQLGSTERAGDDFALRDVELLSVQMTLKASSSSVSIAVKPLANVIPTGIYNYIERVELRNPSDASGLELGSMNFDATPERPPLVTYIVENYAETKQQLVIQTSCDELGINDTLPVTVGSFERKVIPLMLDIPEPPPLFVEGCYPQEKDLGIRSVEMKVSVKEQKYMNVGNMGVVSHRLQALPPDYMIWAVTNHRTAQYSDLRHLIARWVTPNVPELEQFLSSIGLETPSKNPSEALSRIYDGLLSLGFTFDESTLNWGIQMEHNYQRVRLPSVSLTYRHINCIDGTVLLASFMERLGYEPIIVFVPRHAFLGVVQEGTLKQVRAMTFVEATGLCPHWFRDERSIKFDEKLVGGNTLPFEIAAAEGLRQFNQAQEWLIPKPETESGPIEIAPHQFGFSRYRIVPISVARKQGIHSFGRDCEEVR
jgi:tetratricopeptide (TPR) repeat protein